MTAGSLPGGMTLSAAGVLSGSPSAAGPFTFTVSASDANGAPGSAAYSLFVAPDGTAPVSTALAAPPNAAGWNTSDVAVSLTATDDLSGVNRVVYSATGAQAIAEQSVAGSSASFTIDAEGVTTVSHHAVASCDRDRSFR